VDSLSQAATEAKYSSRD